MSSGGKMPINRGVNLARELGLLKARALGGNSLDVIEI